MTKNIIILDPNKKSRLTFKYYLEPALPEKTSCLYLDNPHSLSNKIKDTIYTENTILIGVNNNLGLMNQNGVDIIKKYSRKTKIPFVLYFTSPFAENNLKQKGVSEYFFLPRDLQFIPRKMIRFFEKNPILS